MKRNADGDVLIECVDGFATPLLLTTLSPKSAADRNDGISQCLITSAVKRKLLAIEGFPQPLRHPSSPACRIGPSGERGMGMFATRKLRNGEYICAERPLFVMPASTSLMGELSETLAVEMTIESYQQVILREREMLSELAFERMEPEKYEQFMSLANWWVQLVGSWLCYLADLPRPELSDIWLTLVIFTMVAGR